MPIITVEDVECPYCGDVADVEIDDTLTAPQFDECGECGDEFQITWDPIAKTATVEEIEEDGEEGGLLLVEGDDEEDDDPDETE